MYGSTNAIQSDCRGMTQDNPYGGSRNEPKTMFGSTSNANYGAFFQNNDNETSRYRKELLEQVRYKKQLEAEEKEKDRAIDAYLSQFEGSQWGRPGPGGVYWRPSAITGQRFFQNMGWNCSPDPRVRPHETKKLESEDIVKSIALHDYKKEVEHMDRKSAVGVELVPLMMQQYTGKPRIDPQTGYMMSHSLSSTDVTRKANFGPSRVNRAITMSNLSRI